MSLRHHIKKLRISLGNSGPAGDAVTKDFYVLQQELKADLERLFDQYFPGEKEVHIAKLSIDVGSLPIGNYQQLYKNRVISLIEKELAKYQQPTEVVLPKRLSLHVDENRLGLIQRFLVSGYLPGSLTIDSFSLKEEVEQLLLDKKRLSAFLLDHWEKEEVRFRLMRQLPVDLFEKLAKEVRALGKPADKEDLLIFSILSYFKEGKKEVADPFPLRIPGLIFGLSRSGVQRLINKLMPILNQEPVRLRIAKTWPVDFLHKAFSQTHRHTVALERLHWVQEVLLSQKRVKEVYFQSIEWKLVWLRYLTPSHSGEQTSALVELMESFEIEDLTVLVELEKKDIALFKELKTSVSTSGSFKLSSLEGFVFFLRKGIWQAEDSVASVLEQLLKKESPALRKALLPLISRYEIRKRMVHQIQPAQLRHVLALLISNQNQWDRVAEVISFIKKRWERNVSESLYLYQAVFEVVFSTDFTNDGKEGFFSQLFIELIQLLPEGIIEKDQAESLLERREFTSIESLAEALELLGPITESYRQDETHDEAFDYESEEINQLLEAYFLTGDFRDWSVDEKAIQDLIRLGVAGKEPKLIQVFDQIKQKPKALARFIEAVGAAHLAKWVEAIDPHWAEKLAPFVNHIVKAWQETSSLVTLSYQDLWSELLTVTASNARATLSEIVHLSLASVYRKKILEEDNWKQVLTSIRSAFNDELLVSGIDKAFSAIEKTEVVKESSDSLTKEEILQKYPEVIWSLMQEGVTSGYYRTLTDGQLAEVFQMGPIAFERVKRLSIHDTFWEEVLPGLTLATTRHFFEQLTAIHHQAIVASQREVEQVNEELSLKVPFPPLEKKALVSFLKTYLSSYSSLSKNAFSNLLFEEQLAGEFGAVDVKKYKAELSGALLPKQVYHEKFPLMIGWLKEQFGKQPVTEFDQFLARLDSQEGFAGLDEELVQLITSKQPGSISLLVQKMGDKVYDDPFTSLLDLEATSQLVAYFEPTYAADLLSFYETIGALNLEKRFNISKLKIKELLIGSLLRVSRRYLFSSEKEAVSAYLSQIATELGVTTTQIIAPLKEKKSFRISGVLDELIKDFDDELTTSWELDAIAMSQRGRYTSSDLILHYLQNKSLPEWSIWKDEQSFGKYLAEGIQRHAGLFAKTMMRLPLSSDPGAPLQKIIGKGLLTAFLRQTTSTTFQQMEALAMQLSSLLKVPTTEQRKRQTEVVFFDHWFTSQKMPAGSSAESEKRLIRSLLTSYQMSETSWQEFAGLASAASSYPLLKGYMQKMTDESVEGVAKPQMSDFTLKELVRFYIHAREFPTWSHISRREELNELIKREGTKGVLILTGILREVTETPHLIKNFVGLLDEKLVFDAVKSVNQSRFRLLAPVYQDVLKAYDQGEKNRFKLIAWLIHEVIQSTESDPEVWLQHGAQRLSVEKEVLIRRLAARKNDLTSDALRTFLEGKKKAKDTRVLDVEVETKASPEGEASSPSGNEIVDAFQHVLLYEEIPWWYEAEDVEKEKYRLHGLVMASHLSEFLSTMQQSGREQELLEKWVELLSFREFNQVVTQLAPGVASFVVMFLRAVEGATEKSFSLPGHRERMSSFFFTIFAYVKGRSSNFSATEFVGFAMHQLAGSLQVSYDRVVISVTSSSRRLHEKGETKFSILNEVLSSWQSMEQTMGPHEEWLIEQTRNLGSAPTTAYAQTDFEESLSHYLTYGSLPVASRLASFAELLTAFADFASTYPDRARALLQRFLSSTLVVQRLAKQGKELIIRMAALLLKVKVERLESWFSALPDILGALLPGVLTKDTFEYIAMEAIWKHVSSTHTTTLDLFELTNRYFRGVADRVPDFHVKAAAAAPNYQMPAHTPVGVKKAIENLLAQDKPGVRSPMKGLASEMLADYVQVDNAGLALLVNFLPMYFERLEMTANRAFKSEEIAERAVLLTQYLVSGRSEAPEHELVLNKIICGVVISESVPLSIEMSDREKEVSDSLMQGVIQNWTRMSHISIEALREGFLIRQGQVSENEAQWLLEVEKEAIDLLLETLPWSFKTIKLPWMKKNLNVKWGQ